MRRLLLVVCAAMACLLTACSEPAAKFTSTDVSGGDWGKDFHLTDHTGKQRTLADFKGKVVVLFFGYTQCPDVCPTTLTVSAAALKLLGPDASKVQVLFATLDPARDTQEVLSKYAPAFDPSFIGLYGNEAETAAAAKEFKVFYQKQPGSTPQTYTIDHTAASYAFDPQGRLRLYIKHGVTPEQLAADLKLLIQGK
ncbi:MAG TPA: SCO family protein [Rhodocyclaceae bacterium]|jgi:protein SCO1/2|nr:SCO family protein [Rhodocyclaceae bacterium]